MAVLIKCQNPGLPLLPTIKIALFALLLAGYGGRLAGQEAPCLNRTLAVTVTVTTQDYQPVKDLTAANFSARVGHQQLKIVSVSLHRGPRIVIVLDASGSMVLGDIQKWKTGVAAAEGLVKSAPPSTSFALLTFATRIESRVQFGQGVDAVAEKLRELEDTNWKKELRRTALMDAIAGAVEMLGAPRLGDAIYLVSDGGENASKLKESREYARLLSSGVRLFAFFPIGLGSRLYVPEFGQLRSHLFVPELYEGLWNLGQVTKESGGDSVTCMSGGPPDPPDSWPHSMPVYSGAHAAIQAARMMDEEVTFFYRLEVELPKPLDKPREWRLEATKLIGEKNVHLRVNYPRKLQPCQ